MYVYIFKLAYVKIGFLETSVEAEGPAKMLFQCSREDSNLESSDSHRERSKCVKNLF